MIISAGIFYLWWLSVNAFLCYAEYDFFSQFAAAGKIRPRQAALYIGVNCIFTFIVLSFPIPVPMREIIHAGIMYISISCLFQCGKLELIPPAVIIFSLSTFMDGISAVLMRCAAQNITSSALGNIIHISLTAALALLFFLILRRVASRLKFSLQHTVASCLYALLLPCTFVVWVIRFGFGLDKTNLSAAQFPFAGLSLLWALAAISGAAATFFTILMVFENIVALSQRETENALLNSQLRREKIHLAEAQKRDGQLRSFQHDIDNHLAVLSGLLEEHQYGNAQEYLRKLHVSSTFLRRQALTGNPALDIILREKTGYAKQNRIPVSCRASLPPGLPVDDMDLCIIISNALDNAIQACLKPGRDRPGIELVIQSQRQFLLIETTNPYPYPTMPVPGTGLKNIRRTAEKYGGTAEISVDSGRFRLSVLLCLKSPDAMPDTDRN